jgi:hypothetical protein
MPAAAAGSRLFPAVFRPKTGRPGRNANSLWPRKPNLLPKNRLRPKNHFSLLS